MYKIVIFDFDYTLGDSTDGIVASANYALDKLGYTQYSVEEIKKTIGLSLPASYEMLTKDTDEDNKKIYTDNFIEKANEVMTASTIVYPYADRLLRELANKGIRVGIVTTKYRYRIDAILEKFDLTEYVELIIGGDDVKKHKPDPEGLLYAVERFGVKKSEVLYVGDSFVDAKTAEGAEVDFAAVLTGTTSKEEFMKYKNIGIFNNVSEIDI